jgi:hypothetical protein
LRLLGNIDETERVWKLFYAKIVSFIFLSSYMNVLKNLLHKMDYLDMNLFQGLMNPFKNNFLLEDSMMKKGIPYHASNE